MKTRHLILAGLLAFVLAGIAAVEHVFRRKAEGNYLVALERQQELQVEVQSLGVSKHLLEIDLEAQRKANDSLSARMSEKDRELEKALSRLSEETKTVQDLRARLDVMHNQMDALQSELLVAIDDQGGTPVAEANGDSKGAVELERVVVSSADAAELHGRVISVHPEWSFVIVDLGWSTVSIGDTISIFKGDSLMAKARIERVQEGLSAATLLPDWEISGVEVDDTVKVL